MVLSFRPHTVPPTSSTDATIASLHAATAQLQHDAAHRSATLSQLLHNTATTNATLHSCQIYLRAILLQLARLQPTLDDSGFSSDTLSPHPPPFLDTAPSNSISAPDIPLQLSSVTASTNQPNQCDLQIHTPSSISSTISLPRVPKPPSLKSPENNIPPIVSPPPSGTSQLQKPSSTSIPQTPALTTLNVTPLLTPTQLPLTPPPRPLLLPLTSTPQQSSHPFELPTCPSLALCAPCAATFLPSHRCSTSQFPHVADASPAPTPPPEPPPVLSLVPPRSTSSLELPSISVTLPSNFFLLILSFTPTFWKILPLIHPQHKRKKDKPTSNQQSKIPNKHPTDLGRGHPFTAGNSQVFSVSPPSYSIAVFGRFLYLIWALGQAKSTLVSFGLQIGRFLLSHMGLGRSQVYLSFLGFNLGDSFYFKWALVEDKSSSVFYWAPAISPIYAFHFGLPLDGYHLDFNLEDKVDFDGVRNDGPIDNGSTAKAQLMMNMLNSQINPSTNGPIEAKPTWPKEEMNLLAECMHQVHVKNQPHHQSVSRIVSQKVC